MEDNEGDDAIPIARDECWTCGTPLGDGELAIDVQLMRVLPGGDMKQVPGGVFTRAHLGCAFRMNVPGVVYENLKAILEDEQRADTTR